MALETPLHDISAMTALCAVVEGILEEPIQPANIRFDFTTPERLYPWGIRGRSYDKILIDLTDDTRYRHRQTIEEAMWTEKSKWR